LGNFVRGLTLSVSGFLGMWLCMSYTSSAYSPYLVPVGLGSITLGVTGFVIMVSGMNQKVTSSVSDQARCDPDLQMDNPDRSRMNDVMDIGRLDDPTVKM
jgi:hypothetical protein